MTNTKQLVKGNWQEIAS